MTSKRTQALLGFPTVASPRALLLLARRVVAASIAALKKAAARSRRFASCQVSVAPDRPWFCPKLQLLCRGLLLLCVKAHGIGHLGPRYKQSSFRLPFLGRRAPSIAINAPSPSRDREFLREQHCCHFKAATKIEDLSCRRQHAAKDLSSWRVQLDSATLFRCRKPVRTLLTPNMSQRALSSAPSAGKPASTLHASVAL